MALQVWHSSFLKSFWIFASKNNGSADRKLIDCFSEALIDRGIPIKKSIFQPSLSENASVLKDKCAFCRKEVIDSQIIFETPFSYLLCNYKSRQNQFNFLITSVRHVQSITQLRQEEIQDFHRLTQLFLQILEQKFNKPRCAMLIQEGPLVGQTEPHVHMHVHVNPSDLRFPLHYLNYRERKPLSREEMAPVIQELGERMKLLTTIP
jgi:diadenosine tetraphosphate (Ap4A) HIT family hydrolase